MTRIGVAALQGGFAAHLQLLRGIGVEAVEVRRPETLREVDALVLPGGESTAQLVLMGAQWAPAVRAFAAEGHPILGTCAGAILLAREVAPEQEHLGLIDVSIARNGYGRQRQSFEADLDIAGRPAHAVFIRAPRITRVGPRVEVLASFGGEPVAVREGGILAATFHPELAGVEALHRELARLAGDARPAGLAAATR